MPDVCGSGKEGVLIVVGLEHEQHDGWLAVVVEFSPATGEVPAVGPEAFGHALWRSCASQALTLRVRGPHPSWPDPILAIGLPQTGFFPLAVVWRTRWPTHACG